MSEDIEPQPKDIRGRTWLDAFYVQTKAFLEKNSEHVKEIERLKAAAHDDDTCPHLVRANLLEAENARLKAEVENLLPKDYYDPLLYHCGECQRMSAYLAFATSKYIRADTEIARLKAEVERLKVELADAQESYHIVNEQVAKFLKEGKQP